MTASYTPRFTPSLDTFDFVQGTPATVWTITHNLGKRPSFVVLDSANDEVEPDPVYVDTNTLVLSFTAPFSGVAYLN